jgi:HAD superfamily hydrolase (TIGR01549 family)
MSKFFALRVRTRACPRSGAYCLCAHTFSSQLARHLPRCYKHTREPNANAKDLLDRLTTQLSVLRAFIFDIDGTLVDSNELHVDSWDRAFRKFGKHFPREALRAQIGKGSDQYLPEFLTPDEIDRFGKELDEYRSELFRKEYLPKVRPFPKVRELFQRIRDDHKRIVLASSGKKADTEYYVKLLKIDNLIEGYVSGDDADNSKPAPDIFAASLKKLGGISPADAVTVGDTRFDIEAARKAGLKTIAFLCGGTSESVLRQAGAVVIYRDPADFLAHYDELTTSNVLIPESGRGRI